MSRSNEGPSGAEKLAALLNDIRRMKEGLLQHAHSGAVRNNPTYEPSDEPTTRASPPQAEHGLRVELPMDLDESLEDMVAKDAQLQYILSPQAEEQVRKSQRLDASSTPGGNAEGAFAGSSPSGSAAAADQRTTQPWQQAQRGGAIASHQLAVQDTSTTSSFQTPIRGPTASAGASPTSAAPTTSDATSASALRTPATSTASSRKPMSRIARPPGSLPPTNSSSNTTPAAAGAAAATPASAQHTPAPAAAPRPLHGASPAASTRSATHNTPASNSTPSTSTSATATRHRGAIGTGAMAGGTLAFGRHSSATGTPSARSSGSLSIPATGPSTGGHPTLGTRASGPSAASRQSSLDAAAPSGIARKRPLTASSDGTVAGGPAARRSGAGNAGVGAATSTAAGPAGQGTSAKPGRAAAGAGAAGSRISRPGVGSTTAAVAQMLGTGHGGQSRTSPASSPRDGAAAAAVATTAAAALPAAHRSAKALSVEADASELQCQPSQPSLTLPTVGTTGDLMDETLESYMAEDPALSHFLAATAMEDAVQATPSAASTPLGAGARPDSEELLQPLADAAAAATAGGTLMDEDADEEMILLLGNTGAAAHGPSAAGGAAAGGVAAFTAAAVARSSVSIAELSPPAAASPASAAVSPGGGGAGAVGTPQGGTPQQQLRFATPGGAVAAVEAAGMAGSSTGAGVGGGPAASPKPALGTTVMQVSALLGLDASPPAGSGSETSPGPPQRESSEELWRSLRDEANSVYERNATPQHQQQQHEQQQQSPLAGPGSLEAATVAALQGLAAPPAPAFVRSPGAGSVGSADGALLLPVRTSSAGLVLSRKESMSIGPQAHTVTLSEDEDASHTGTPVAAVATAAAARARAGADATATTTAAAVIGTRTSYGGADFEDLEVLAAAAAAAAAAVATPSETPGGPFETGVAAAAAAVAAGSTAEPEAEMAEADRQPYQRSVSSTSSVGFDAAVAFEAAQVSRMFAGGSVLGGASWSEGGRVGSKRASAGGMVAFGAVPEAEAEGEVEVEAAEGEAGEEFAAEAEDVAAAMEPEAEQQAEEAAQQDQELQDAGVGEEASRQSAAGAATAAAAATTAAAAVALASAGAAAVAPSVAPAAPPPAPAVADSPPAHHDEDALANNAAMQATATAAGTAVVGADATVLAPRQVALLQEQHQQQQLLPASSSSSAVDERFFSAISAAPPPVEALALAPAASAASSTAAELPPALVTDAAARALEDPAGASADAASMVAAGGGAGIAAVAAVAPADADMEEADGADMEEEMYDDAREDGFVVSAGGAQPPGGEGLGGAGLEGAGAAAAATWAVVQVQAMEAGAAVQVQATEAGTIVQYGATDAGAIVQHQAMEAGTIVQYDATDAGAIVQAQAMEAGAIEQYDAMEAGAVVQVQAMEAGTIEQYDATEAGAVVQEHAMVVALGPVAAAGSEAGAGGADSVGAGPGDAAGAASGSSDADADEDAKELPAKLRKTVTEGGVLAGAAVPVGTGGAAAAADGDAVGEGQAAGEEVEGGSRKRARSPAGVPVAEGMQGGAASAPAEADAAGGGEVSGNAETAAGRQDKAGEAGDAAGAREQTQPGSASDRAAEAADIPAAPSPGADVAAAAGTAASSGFATAEQQLAGVSSGALAGPDGASRAPSDASRKSVFELGPGSTVLSNAAEGSVSKAIDDAVAHANLQHIPPEALPSDTFSLALDDSSRPHGSTPTAGFSAATSTLSNAGQPSSPSARGALAPDTSADEAGTAAAPAVSPVAGAPPSKPDEGTRGQEEQHGGAEAPSAAVAGTAAVPAVPAIGVTPSSPGEHRQGQEEGESGAAATSAAVAGAAMACAAAAAAAVTTASPQAANVATSSGPQPTPLPATSGATEAPPAPIQYSGSGRGLPPRAPSSSSVPPAFPSTASHSPAVLSPSLTRGSPSTALQPGQAAMATTGAATVPAIAAAYPAVTSQPASFLVPPPLVLGEDGEPLRHAWQVAAAAGANGPASGGDPPAPVGEYAAAARASLGTRPSLRSMRGGSAASSRLSRISSRRDADTHMEDVERVAEDGGEDEAAAEGSGAATVVAVAVAGGDRALQNGFDGGDAMEVDGGRGSGGSVAAAAAMRGRNVSSNGVAGGDGEEQLVPAWKLVAARSSSGPDGAGAGEGPGGASGPGSPAAVVPGMSPPLGSRKSLRSIMLPSGGSRLQRSTRASESGETEPAPATTAATTAVAAGVSAAAVAVVGGGLSTLPASPWGTEAAISATGPPAAGTVPLPPPPPPPPASAPVDDDDVPLQPAWKVLAAPLAANLDAAQAVAAARSVPLGSQPSFRSGRTRSSRLHRASATDAEDTAGLGISPPGADQHAGEFERNSNGASPERHHMPMDLDHLLPPGASPTVPSPGMAMGIPGGRSRARTQPGSSPGGTAAVSFSGIDPAGGGGSVALPGMAPGIRSPVISVSSGGGLARAFLRSTSSNVRRASAMEVPQPGSPRGGMSDNGSLAAMLAARISSRRLMTEPVGSVPLPRRSSCSGGDPNVDALRPAWQVLPLAMGLASGSNTPGGSSSSPGAEGTPAGVPPTAAQMLGSMRSSSRLSRMSSGIPEDLLAELKAQAHAAVGHLQGSPGDQGEGGFAQGVDLLSSQDDADGYGGAAGAGGAAGGRPRHSVTVVTPPPPSGDGAGGTLHAWKMLPSRVPATSASGLEHEQQQQQQPTSPGPLGFGPSPRASQMGGLGARPTLGMTRGANPSSRFATGAAKPAALSSPQVTFETPRVVAPEPDSAWATPPPTSMHAPPMQGAPFGAAYGRLSASGAMQAGTHASASEESAATAGADEGVLHAWKLAIPPASAGSSGAPAATAGTTASTPTRPAAIQHPLGSRPSLKSIRTNSMGGSRLSRATSMADDYVDDSYSAPNLDTDIPDADGPSAGPGPISPAASRGTEPAMPYNVIGGDRTSAPAAIGALPPGVLYGSRPGLRGSPAAAASPTRLDVVPSVGSASGAATSETSTSSGSEPVAAAGRPPLTRGTTTGSLNVPPALSVESGAPMGEATMARVLASRHSIRSNRSSTSSRLSRMSSARDADPNAMPAGVNAAAASGGQWDLGEIREEDGEGSLAVGGNSGRTSASTAALADRVSPGAPAVGAARLSGSGAARPPALYVAAPVEEEEEQQLLPAWKVLGNVGGSGEMGLAPGESPMGPAGSGGMGSVPTPLSSLSGRRSLRSIRSNSMGSSRLSRVSTAGDGALEDIVEEGTESASTMAAGAAVVGTDGEGSSSHDSNIAPERTSAGRAPPPAPSTGAARIGAPVVGVAATVGSGGFFADGALAPPAVGSPVAAVAVAEEEKLLPAWKVLGAAEAAAGGAAVAADGGERVASGSALGSIRQPSLRTLRSGSRLSRMTSNVDDKEQEEEEEQQQGAGQAAGGLVSPAAAAAANASLAEEAAVAAAFAGTAAAVAAAGAPGSPRPAEAMEVDGDAAGAAEAAAAAVPAPAVASSSGAMAAAAASALGYSGSEMDTGGLPAGPGGLSSVVDSATTTQSNLNLTFATLPQFKSGFSKTSDTAPTPLSVSALAAGSPGTAAIAAAVGEMPASAGSPPVAIKEEDALPSPAAAASPKAAAAPSAPASPAAAQAAVSHTDVEVAVAEEPQRTVEMQQVQQQQVQPSKQEVQPPAKAAKPKRRGGLFACFGCGCGVKEDEP